MTTAIDNRQSGFTLIEVLVGLTLFGLLSALLVSALYTLGSGSKAGEARVDEFDSNRLIAAFLRNQLENIYPVTQTDQTVATVLFEGRPERLRYIGHLPSHRSGGGLSLLTLSLDDESGGSALILGTSPRWRDTPFASGGPVPVLAERALLTGIDSLSLRYFGADADGANARWRDRWQDREVLPTLVRLELRVDGRDWPPIVASLRATSAERQPQLLLDDPAEGA